MLASTVVSCSGSSPTISSPSTSAPAEHSAGIDAQPAAADAAARSVLRVGDYEVGETFCPRLCGHPDIRY